MSDLSTHAVLVKARAYLLQHGWTQNSYGAHGGPRCVYGALRSAYGAETAVDSFAPILAIGDQIGSYCVADWNDDDVRTFEQVIDAFDKAILATAPSKPDESPLTALEDLPAEQYIDCLSTLALIPMEALA